jgi:D-beta-D-heptose 7-phosphate kinase/D-beta-D-heptose 1-phosphate adenosyltransferase
MTPPTLTPERFREMARRFGDHPVLVVGDVMIDEYVWGEAGRISPEAPVPVVEVSRETLRLGGAANVARNLVTLGGRVELLAVVGRDARAEQLRDAAAGQGIGTEALVEDPDRPTTLKTRIMAARQQIVRVDRESCAPLGGEVRVRFLQRLREAMGRAAGVIVSDYGKGVVDLELMRDLAEAARARGIFVAVDPKESHFYQYRHVSVVTPNVHEAGRATRLTIRDGETLEAAGRQLLEDLESEAVLITRGPEGMSLFLPGQATLHIPVMAREVYDVTGAGDTVVAALTVARVAGASLSEAAILSNAAAAVVVGKMGTAAVSVAELAVALEAGYPAGGPPGAGAAGKTGKAA